MYFYKQMVNALSVKKRYLLQFGYIGTHFSGVQRQMPYVEKVITDVTTVQGLLEYALSGLKPLNEARVFPSSRTDAGVHAFRSTAHVDLEFPCEHHHNPYAICKRVNKFFNKAEIDIRLHNVVHVPDNFSGRHQAIWRKYVYRVAVIKDKKHNCSSHNFLIPMTEHNRCHIILNSPLEDMESARECARMILGTHDFCTFMASTNEHRGQEVKTTRTLESFDIGPGRPFFDTIWDEQFDYWDFTVVGRSFLYKQVRRLVAALVAVAQRRLTVEEFRYMLENPSLNNWPSKLQTAPPYGLYLMDIGYREEDLSVPKDNTRYSLLIDSLNGTNKLEVIKLFRELHGGCTILQARDSLNSLPAVVRSDLIEREARYYQSLFEKAKCGTRLEARTIDEKEGESSSSNKLEETLETETNKSKASSSSETDETQGIEWNDDRRKSTS